MGSSASIFSGNSRYSSDFQAVIERTVAIASLPSVQLQQNKTTLESQSAAITAFRTAFNSFQNSFDSLDSSTGLSSYSSSVSDASILRATVGEGVLAGAYSVEVTSLGAHTSTMSKDGLTAVADPATQNLSASGSYTLTVNGVATTITPAANTLNALVAAINEADDGVQATIVNIGSSETPNYRLSLLSEPLGADTVQLNDGTVDLLDTMAAGSKATYKVNGLATAIESTSRTVTLSPGLTIDLLKQSAPGTPMTVSVARTTASISNALSAMTSAYNTVVDEVNKHRGEAGGALSGQSLLQSLDQVLEDMTSYSGGAGAIQSLTDLGLEFDAEGKLSLNVTTFDAAVSGNFAELALFLGDSDSGFIENASTALDTLLNETDGIFETTGDTLTEQITAQQASIDAAQIRIDQLREGLTAQVAAADALIATLEQQVLYINNLFESMRIASKSM